MNVLPAWMSVHYINTWYLRRSEEGIKWRNWSYYWLWDITWVLRNQIQILWKGTKCSQLLSHLSNPSRKGLLMWIFPASWGVVRILHALPNSRAYCLFYPELDKLSFVCGWSTRTYYHPECEDCLYRWFNCLFVGSFVPCSDIRREIYRWLLK